MNGQIDLEWTVQPPKGMLKGDYYRIEERFPPYYKGIPGQFPDDPGHLGIVEAVKVDGRIVWVELNEITAPTYYRHLYPNISKRRSSFSFWQYEKARMQEAKVVLTMGLQYVERQMLEQQRLSGAFDFLNSASGSAKKLIAIATKLEAAMEQPSAQTLYSYAEDFGYGITGWLKVVLENGKIVSCRYDEIFADHPGDIVHPELKQYYRQSKYDCVTYEDPFPAMFDRHAFLVGFRTQMDNLNSKVAATQNLLDISGLPHSAGVDLGPLWDDPCTEKKPLDMKQRPIYPALRNYQRLAAVVLEEMKKDGYAPAEAEAAEDLDLTAKTC